MRLTKQRTFATLAIGALLALFSQNAANAVPVVYQEVGGSVTAEAEFFSNREAAGGGAIWLVVPNEDPGAGVHSNARGGAYVQALPDGSGGGGGPNNTPFIEYQMQISTPGNYQLFARWDGRNGQSDSIFFSVNELSVGASSPGHYEDSNSGGANGHDADFATNPWDGLGGANQNQAGASQNPMTWNIAAPGVYTLRVSQREDGAALDAFTFQLDSLAAPTGDGFNASPILSHSVALTPTDDAYVRNGGSANTTHGTTDPNNLLVKAASNSFTRKSYLKFDLSNLDLDTVMDADLTLEVKINNNGGSPQDPTPKAYTIDFFGLNDGDAGEGWDEDTLTANNAPANDTSNNDILSNATLLGSLTVPALNPDLESDPVLVKFIDDALLEFLRADTNGSATIIMRRQAGLSNNFGFASKEANGFMAPTLSLFTTVPEPTTALLGLMGLAGLASRRRRAA